MKGTKFLIKKLNIYVKFTSLYIGDSAAIISVASTDIYFDSLLKLSELFETKNINIGSKVKMENDTFDNCSVSGYVELYLKDIKKWPIWP